MTELCPIVGADDWRSFRAMADSQAPTGPLRCGYKIGYLKVHHGLPGHPNPARLKPILGY
jgi:hypothetical protein